MLTGSHPSVRVRMTLQWVNLSCGWRAMYAESELVTQNVPYFPFFSTV